MNFLVKAFAQNLISCFPKSERVDYSFQKHISRSLPSTTSQFISKLGIANRHLAFFETNVLGIGRSNARFFEFGAGWDLVVPIAFSLMGIGSQVVIDNKPNARLELINNTLSRIRIYESNIEGTNGVILETGHRNVRPVRSLADLSHKYGIDWLAPVDATRTGLPLNSFDFISSTVTFEHMPANILTNVFMECYRILKPGGIMSCLIDLKDHYASFDSKISIYNFLEYSDWTWNRINSSIHFQNRLRSADYTKIVAENTGFQILQVEEENPEDEDLDVLKSLRLEKRFRQNYSFKELGVKSTWLVLKK
jgi:SAM-dependent methyltransferase